MDIEPITLSDISNYINRHPQKTVSPDALESEDLNISDDLIFEAVSETIANKNPEFEIKSFTKLWTEQTKPQSRYEFASEKFNQVLTDEVRELLTVRQQDKWIEYTVQGMNEVSELNDNL